MLDLLTRLASANIGLFLALLLVLLAWVVQQLLRLAATNRASIERRS